ncbi:MAG TPA: hypothetical protein VK534_02755, partial [Methylomirabilota bacterium]|nr:hypothetical protein [Methylomirabilota bacterium]
MAALHELLGRDLDPIDDIRHRFEHSYTEDYYNPVNGDWISDNYFEVIDLATQPVLSEKTADKLDQAIIRLNEKHVQIRAKLG